MVGRRGIDYGAGSDLPLEGGGGLESFSSCDSLPFKGRLREGMGLSPRGDSFYYRFQRVLEINSQIEECKN
jgi:hypothetical protein